MSDFFEREGQSPFPAGPRPPEQRAWFDQPEINSDYAQKFYERQQNLERYRVDLSNDEFAVLNQLFPNERNEEEYSENRYRVATAMQLARMYDISIEDAYANVDSILEATYDRKMLYKDSFKAVSDSFALGTNQVKMAVLGNRLLLATDIDERNKLWKEIEEIGRDNETLADGVTRNMFLEGLKGLGNSWGFTATSAGAGFLGGLINPALGVVSAAAVSSAQMIGLEYISLLSQGIDDETARSTAIASGIFQGVVEAVFGDVAALGAGTGLGQIIFRQLHYSGAIGAAARIIGGRVVDILMEGAGESVQEMGSQSFAEAARQKTEEKVRDIIARDDIFDKRERAAEDLATEAYRIYYEKTSREDGFGNMLPRPTTEEQDQAVKESFRVATLTSLITGVPIIGRDVYVTRRDIRQLGAAQKVASNIDEFKELTKDNEAFKGMTDENKSKIQEEIFNAGAAQREAEAERVREESAPPPPGARPLVEYPAASRRQEGGRLSVRLPEGALNEDFTETHRMTIHDPEDDQLYGRLDFRRGENGDIQIDGIQVRSYITDRDQVIMDAVKELGVNFPGARIDWDPENTGDRILRDRLLNGRPPGLDLGLNWFDGKKDYEAVESQAEQQGWIADVAPQIPAEQRQTAYEVAGFLYRSRGESAEDWGRRVEFTNTVPEGMREGFTAAQGGEGRVKGATFDWAEVAGKTKRYIYLSEKADFSTLNHELIHDHIKALSNEQRGEWEAAIGLTDGDWNAGRYEGRNGKAVNAHEYVAEAFEDYLTQKKEPPSSGLKALFDRIIGFMRNIYGALRDNNKINPELKRKFDEIFAEEASGTGREAEANPYEYEAEFDRKLERLNEDSRKRAREMLGGEAREQQARDEVIADPEAAMDNAERIEKLKNSPDIVLDDKAYQGKYEIDKSPKENNRSITSYLKNFMKKERLENPYIADPIRLGNKGIAKITSYGMSNPVYMKSIAHIPAMLKNAILIEESNKNRPTAHYQGFKHLISGIEIDGEKYTAHIILGENAGIWYYQHNLSKIEKGALIEVIQATNSGLQGSLSEIKDTTLIGILQDPKKTKLQGESFDSADPSIQFQIIGEQGAAALDRAEEITARLDNLNIARQMEAAEKDAKTIRLATGWERGADGKWRYEIPDLKIKPEISEDIDNRDNPEGYGFVIGEGGKLGDFVDADALFTAYPQLKDVSVFYDEGLDANAGYNPKEKAIRLGNNIDQGSEEFRSLLIHETQHAIQEIEGFAIGGNANQFTRQNNKQSILDGIDKARQKAFNEIPENLKEAARTVNRGEDADGLALAHIQADPEAKAAWADYIRALADAAEIAGIPNEQFDGLSPEEQYQRLAGETEARNAVARMGFTPEQRLETLLEETEDVSREDQIFLAASALFQPASDTEILFQLADEEITRAVFQFPSWEAWKFNDESLGFFGLDTALPGGLTGAEAEAWYKATWERKRAEAAAQDKTADPLTSSQIDGRLLEKWRSEKGLTEWLKALQQARQEDSYSGTAMDEDGGRAREEQAVLRNRIEHEVHPAVKMAAQRVFRGRSLTDTQRKTVMTLLERGIPYYRNLYVNITGDSEFSGYAGNEIRENRYAEAAGEENLSVFQKQQLAKKLENEEIRRKYKNGTLTEDETRTYIETLKREKREAEAKLKKAEAELLEDEKRLSDDDRELYRRQQELDRNESTLTGYEEEIVRLEEALAKEQARGRREKAESRREIEKANLAGRMHQGRYGAARLRVELEKLTEKARELRADIARRKKELTRQKKEGAAGISRAKAIAALEKKGALEKLKAQIKSKEAERRAAAKILAGRRRKVAAILKAPGPGIWHENRDRIKALQESFLEGVNPTDKGKQVTWNKKPMPVAEFRQKVARGEINAGLLDKRLTDRVFRRDLNELFDSELDDLLAEIRSLEAEGRAVWQEKEARREHRVKSEIGRLRNGIDLLVEEGKTREARRLIEYMKAKTTEEARKIAESADSPLTKALWETWKDANLFKTMQGGKNEGVMTDLLRKEGNLAKRRKVLEVDRRVSQVLDLAEELKFDINAAKRKKITIEGLGPDGKDQVLSVTELMLMHVGLNNERMRAAVLYGNFLSPEERLAMRNMLGEAAGQDTEVQKAARVKAKQEARRTGEKYRPPKNERRYRKEVGESINRIGENKEALIRKAMAENLTEKEITIARAIADNFSGNFDRVKDVFFNMFNEDVGEQKSYLPINRKSSVGDKTAHQEAAEALNIGTHMVSVSVDEGMMHDRLNIKPWNQTDIELDIFNVFFKGVEREEHFAAFAPYVRNLNAVFKQKNYGAEAMQRRLEIMYGKWAVTRVRDYINILAAPDSIRSDTAENFLDALSGKAAMADIGFNVASYLAQYPQSAAAFLGHINLFEYLGAVKDRMKDRKLFDQMVREKSTVMRRRIINYAQEYVRHMKDSGKFSQAQIKYADMAMKMQEVADWQTVSTGWWAAYKKELKKNGGNETAAILQADEIVLGTQPDMDETELAPIFRGGKGHLPKALVRYGAPLNTVWNQLTYGLPNAVANKTFGNYLSLYASIGMANLLVAFMRGKFSDEDDEAEDWVKKIAYYLLLSPVAESVPVISDATGWLAERAVTGEKIPRLQRKFFPFAESVIKAGVEVKEFALDGENRTEEKFWKTFWDVMEAGAYGTGTPINQARKIREAYNEKTFWPVIGFRKSK